jgi:TRAP-type C4-dicarboxylate transport system permease small subunit
MGWAQAEPAFIASLRWLDIICLIVLLVLVTGGILVRFLPGFSLGWADEIIELAFAWMVFLGTALLWRDERHITVAFLPEMLAGTRAGRVLEGILALLLLTFLAIFIWQGWLLTVQAVGNRTPILALPKPAWYAVLPLSGIMMFAYTLRRCLRAIRPGPRGVG